MLDLVLGLVDRLIALVKRREAVDRQLHDDFLAPLIADFDALHAHYLKTFGAYRSEIATTQHAVSVDHPVLARIDEDSLYSSQLRGRLKALADWQDDPALGELVRAVLFYLRTGDAAHGALLYGERAIPNAPRRRLSTGLREIFASPRADADKIQAGVAAVDRVVLELQQACVQVADVQTQTRRRLLDRR